MPVASSKSNPSAPFALKPSDPIGVTCSGVLVDREESVTQDIDPEHATDWIDRDTDNRHALWDAEKVADYRRHDFVASIDADQEPVSVAKIPRSVRANRVKRVSGRIPSHAPPPLDLR